jgi:Sugar (pentulose and hexulose) kinases
VLWVDDIMYILGVDIGTTGTKAMLVSQDGRILSRSYKGYPLMAVRENYVEQNAEDWWNTFLYTVNECTKDIADKCEIKALSISSQGGSMVPVDVNGNCLRNAIVWMDSRGVKEKESFLKYNNDDWFYNKTGWKLGTGLNIVKIQWIKNNENDIYKRTYKFLTTIDYVNYKLTGNYIIDPSNAAMTQLMNVTKQEWDGELLELLGIDNEKLPEIYPSGKVIGHLTEEAAGLLGLDSSISVVNGGHDQYCAAVGAGAVNEGDILLSTGSAWVVLGITKNPIFDRNTYVSPGRHIPVGLWGALSSVPTAGVAMEWFKDKFSTRTLKDGTLHSEAYADIDSEAGKRMESSKDLIFYPYYNGRGFPKWDANLKATLLGLSLQHDRYDIARAVMEGVAFEVKHVLENYKKLGCPTENLRVVGGASKSKLWMEIISNIVGTEVIKFKEADLACIGAAIIAGDACGVFDGYVDGYRKVVKEEVLPLQIGPEREFYNRKYNKYKNGMELIDSYYNI